MSSVISVSLCGFGLEMFYFFVFTPYMHSASLARRVIMRDYGGTRFGLVEIRYSLSSDCVLQENVLGGAS